LTNYSFRGNILASKGGNAALGCGLCCCTFIVLSLIFGFLYGMSNYTSIVANPASLYNDPMIEILSVVALIVAVVIGIVFVVLRNRKLDNFGGIKYHTPTRW